MSAETMTQEDREYAETISADILKWLVDRYQDSEKTDFKLSECKEKFMKISDRFLVAACDFLQQQHYLTIDSSTRIAKYSFTPSAVLLSSLHQTSLKPTAPVMHKRSSEKSMEQDKENHSHQQPIKKVKHHHHHENNRPLALETRPVPLQPHKPVEAHPTEVVKKPVVMAPPPVMATPAPAKFTITVTDLSHNSSSNMVTPVLPPAEPVAPAPASAKKQAMTACLIQFFEAENSDMINCDAFIAYVRETQQDLSKEEILAILKHLENNNSIMLNDGDILRL